MGDISDMKKILQNWADGVKDSDDGEDITSHKNNLLYEEWSPRWKKFQPPMWKIFRWAYKIKKSMFTGVYPVAVSSDTTLESINIDDDSIHISWDGNKFESPFIDEAAERLMKHLNGGNNNAKISK